MFPEVVIYIILARVAGGRRLNIRRGDLHMDKRMKKIRMDDGFEPKPELEPMPAIFGLRFLEEEAAEIHDVVGCLIRTDVTGGFTGTGCDDSDQIVLA